MKHVLYVDVSHLPYQTFINISFHLNIYNVLVFTPTDRPKSVRNSYEIKVIGGVFMLSRCFLDCSVGVEVFVT